MAIPKDIELSATYQSYAGSDIVASITVPGYGTYVIGELQTISYSIHRDKYPVRALGFVSAKGYTNGTRTIAGNLIFTVFDRHLVYRILEKMGKTTGRMLTDEMPPFDVTINFGSEYGHSSKLVIYGVTIVDEGQVMSINDLITENTMSYLARDIDLMRPTGSIWTAKQSDASAEPQGSVRIQMNVKTMVPVKSWEHAELEIEVGNVKGILKDIQNEPLAEKRIGIVSPRFASATFTNRKGEFRFENVPVGEYTLRINHKGAIPYSRLLKVLTDTTTDLGEIKLEPEPYTVVSKFLRMGNSRRICHSDSTMEFAVKTEGDGGVPVPGIPIEWEYRIETDAFRELHGQNYQEFETNNTDKDGSSRAVFIIPNVLPDGSKLKAGDTISIRAKIKNNNNLNITPQYFSLTIGEGETIGRPY